MKNREQQEEWKIFINKVKRWDQGERERSVVLVGLLLLLLLLVLKDIFAESIGSRIFFCAWIKTNGSDATTAATSPFSLLSTQWVCSYYDCNHCCFCSAATAFVTALVPDIFTEIHKQMYSKQVKLNSNPAYSIIRCTFRFRFGLLLHALAPTLHSLKFRSHLYCNFFKCENMPFHSKGRW